MPDPGRAGRLILASGLLVALTAACGGHGHSAAVPTPISALGNDPGSITMSPAPGSHYASPKTQISLRGVTSGGSSVLTVRGSASGDHSGTVRKWSDGRGESWLPSQPFTSGETVTVTSSLPIKGLHAQSAQFTVSRPGTETTPPPPFKSPAAPKPATSHAVSDPQINAPVLDVTANTDPAPGDVILATRGAGLLSAVLVMTKTGQLVWQKSLPNSVIAENALVQRYRGKPVLTWWQGSFNAAHGYGDGADIIVDSSYHRVATVRAGNGYSADLHEFQIASDDTALVSAYQAVAVDLSDIGGSSHALVLDCVVQQIDIPTGLVEFEWHSLDHIPVTASYTKRPSQATQAWDYFHLNSIDEGTRGDLLLSARHTSAVYDVNGASGDLLWTLGGKSSTFPMPATARFGFQHDARELPNGDVSLFDDGAGPPTNAKSSRGLVLHVDSATKTVSVLRVDAHNPPLTVMTQGSEQVLPDGHDFVGWGSLPNATEFDQNGAVVWDAHLPAGVNSYRSISAAWTGRPSTLPSVVVQGTGAQRKVFASWNGDTRTRSWRLVAVGSRVGAARTVARAGFETTIAVPKLLQSFRVEAIGANGRVLATTRPVRR